MSEYTLATHKRPDNRNAEICVMREGWCESFTTTWNDLPPSMNMVGLYWRYKDND